MIAQLGPHTRLSPHVTRKENYHYNINFAKSYLLERNAKTTCKLQEHLWKGRIVISPIYNDILENQAGTEWISILPRLKFPQITKSDQKSYHQTQPLTRVFLRFNFFISSCQNNYERIRV